MVAAIELVISNNHFDSALIYLVISNNQFSQRDIFGYLLNNQNNLWTVGEPNDVIRARPLWPPSFKRCDRVFDELPAATCNHGGALGKHVNTNENTEVSTYVFRF